MFDNLVVGGLTLPKGALSWSASTASGPGGSGKDTANTKVLLRADLTALEGPPELVALVRSRLGDTVSVSSSVERYQFQNRLDALERLVGRLEEAMRVERPRKATRVPRGAKERRLSDKRLLSEKKALRRPDF